MGTNLVAFLDTIKYSTYLLLILFVTFLCLSSKVKFFMLIRIILTESATIGKWIGIWLYSCEYNMRKNKSTAKIFSK